MLEHSQDYVESWIVVHNGAANLLPGMRGKRDLATADHQVRIRPKKAQYASGNRRPLQAPGVLEIPSGGEIHQAGDFSGLFDVRGSSLLARPSLHYPAQSAKPTRPNDHVG